MLQIRVAAAVVVLLVVCASQGAAQSRLRYQVATGPLVDPNPRGFHAAAAVSVPGPRSWMRLRAEALLTDDAYNRHVSTTGGMVLDPSESPLAPYGILGVGVTLAQHLPPFAILGFGWDLPARLRWGSKETSASLPLFVELRGYVGHSSGFGISFGARM